MRQPTGFAGFTIMWVGQLLSAMGTRMTNFALSIWVWQITGRATDLVLMMVFSFVPTVLFSPIAGVLIDRWSRRLTVMLSDIGSAVATGALLLVFLNGSPQIWQLYLVNAATGAFLAFQAPAYSATITLMMERGNYPRANAMMFAVRSAPVIFAPGLAAAVLAALSINTILLIDTLSYVVAIATVLMVAMPSVPKAEQAKASGFFSDAMFGFIYMLRKRPLAAFEGILFAINLLASVGYLLIVPLVLARTGGDEAKLSIVQTVGAIGGVAGVLLLTMMKSTEHKMRRVLVSILLFSLIGRIVYGVGDAVLWWSVGLLVVHLTIPFVDGYAQSIWQEKVEPAAQGRVFAARQFIEDLTVPLAAIVAGPVVDNLLEPWMKPGSVGAAWFGGLVGTGTGSGIALLFILIGVLGVVVVAVAYAMPSVRRIESILPNQGETESTADSSLDTDPLVAAPSGRAPALATAGEEV